jgi:hypothetical protein
MAGTHLNAPIVGIQSDGANGYWLVASDGGVFSFGDATYYGSMAGHPLNAPIVGMAAVDSGYRLVASDGGVFAFGDATYGGSEGGVHLNAPVVGITTYGCGEGYAMVAKDGGVFTFDGAPFVGSAAGQPLNAPIIGMDTETTCNLPGGYFPPPCTASQFTTSVTTNAHTYDPGVVVQIDLAITNNGGDCLGDFGCTDATATSQSNQRVWDWDSDSDSSCAVTAVDRQPWGVQGSTKTIAFDWNQDLCPTGGEACTRAQVVAGTYSIDAFEYDGYPNLTAKSGNHHVTGGRTPLAHNTGCVPGSLNPRDSPALTSLSRSPPRS